MSEKKKSLPKELIKKENTAKKPGSSKAKGFHTVDMKLESFKRQFRIHEKDRIVYKDSKNTSGGQVIRFEKSMDNQKSVHYWIIVLLDINRDKNPERKFPFPEICSKGFMKKESPQKTDTNPRPEPPVSMKEKEKVEEPEKNAVSTTNEPGSVVMTGEPDMSSYMSQPDQDDQNPGIEGLLSEMKKLVYEIRDSLPHVNGGQKKADPSEPESTGMKIKVGDSVWHKKFEKGTVLALDKGYITVHFDKDGKDHVFNPGAFESRFLTIGGERPAATESSPQDTAETDKNANTTPDSGQIESIENPPSDIPSFQKGDIIYLEGWGWGYIADDTSQQTIRLRFDTTGCNFSLSELQTLLKQGKVFTKKELEARRAEYIPKAKKVIRSL